MFAIDSLDDHADRQICEIEAGDFDGCYRGADKRFIGAKHLIAALYVPASISEQYQELGQYHGRRPARLTLPMNKPQLQDQFPV